MDAEREVEIRALAARFMAGTKHRRIGSVLVDLLAEIDLLRGEDDGPHMSYHEAWLRIKALNDAHLVTDQSAAISWRDVARRKAHLYS